MRRILLVALVAGLALVPAACSGGDNDEGATGAEAVEGAAEAPAGAREVSDSGGGEAAVSQPVGEGSSLPPLGPKVIQTAALSLSVPRNRFQEVVNEARTVAAGFGGFVVSSTASQGDERRLERGTLVLRIPGQSYAQAMKSLTGLGRVESREESGQDVSQEYVDLNARARHLEAVERQLLELLGRAESVSAALAVQSRLDDVQLELEQVRGRLRFLDDQVSFATVSLQIHERPAAGRPGGNDGGWGIVDAWKTAAHGFVTVVGWMLVAAATVAPFVLLLALALLAARFARRSIPAWRRP
jgi:Domain of unknown function (DUF4349)